METLETPVRLEMYLRNPSKVNGFDPSEAEITCIKGLHKVKNKPGHFEPSFGS